MWLPTVRPKRTKTKLVDQRDNNNNNNNSEKNNYPINEDDDLDLALRKRRDARRKKFEEKRRLRKLEKGTKREWTSAAAHVKKEKSEKEIKRSKMKGNPMDWVNEESSSESDSSDAEDDDDDDSSKLKKWEEKVRKKGLKSAIEDEKIDKYINVHSSSHGMDSEDFWKF